MFKNLKIRQKLTFALGLALAMMVLVGGAGYLGLRAVAGTTLGILRGEAKLAEYSESSRAHTLGLRRYEKDLFLNIGDAGKQGEYRIKWTEQLKLLQGDLADLDRTVGAEDKPRVAQLRRDLATYVEGFQEVDGLLRSGALRTPQEANAAINKYKDPIRQLIDQAADLASEKRTRMNGAEQVVQDAIQKTTLAMVAFVLLATVLLALLFVGSISKGINAQVGALMELFNRVGMGDFRARARVLSSDELGVAAQSMNAMLESTVGLIQSREERDRIQDGIQKLLVEISGVADGDLTAEAEVTADFTGAIADAFNYMIVQLRQIIRNVQGTTEHVSTAAREIQSTAQHLSQSSAAQTMQIVDTSVAIEEMAASIQQVSANAANAARIAEEGLASAKLGTTAVTKTIRGMEGIRGQVQETSRRIKRLGESSQEIGEIVQLISDIADRTSILALNASIQAAMAGEAGRGFAVVAEEVERLAERSAEATRRIGTLIKGVQSETAEAVGAMEATTREVVAGSTVANDAGSALAEIEGVAHRLAELIQSISLASRQQARGSEQVAKSMGTISEITQQSAAGTQLAAESIRGLAELADNLHGSVAAFKLPGATARSTPRAA